MSSVGTYRGAKSQKGQTYNKPKNFYVEEGSNIYRVLPPFASLAEAGKIAQYHAVHWLKGTDGKSRPVPSVKKTAKDGSVIQSDPVYDKVQTLKAQFEQMKADGVDNKTLEEFQRRLWSLNLDKAYYLNVINPAGEIGTLKLKSTAFDALMKRLDELETKENINAISPGPENGVYFDFKRGKDANGKTVYTCDVHMTSTIGPNGRPVKEYAWAPIDDAVISRMEKEAQDLSKIFTPKSLEEVTLLATLDPKMVDRVFQRPVEVGEVDDVDSMEEEMNTAVLSAKVNNVMRSEVVTPVVEAVTKPAAPKVAAAPKAKAQSEAEIAADIDALIFGKR